MTSLWPWIAKIQVDNIGAICWKEAVDVSRIPSRSFFQDQDFAKHFLDGRLQA